MTSETSSLISSHLRAGFPDFLDLPWNLPFEEWTPETARVVDLPRGLSRHPVVFVSYGSTAFALKQLPLELASKEYESLRKMQALRLPTVEPVGHMQVRVEGDEPVGIVVTKYLEHALPYQSLFMNDDLSRYRDHLLDAMALLLVQLHLAGVFWGDCSLNNTLFRRDAGLLNAYLVDAETTEVHATVSDGMRAYDLDIMEENVFGGLLDLRALDALSVDLVLEEIGPRIREQYARLWDQATSEHRIPSNERFRISERVRKLNELGFSVDEISLEPTENGSYLRLRAQVTDRHFHRDLLQKLTGLDTEEMQARAMLNEIQELKASLSTTYRHSLPLGAVATRWLHETYLSMVDRLKPLIDTGSEPPEVYCQLLEHKWYLSERASSDVGHAAAADDLLNSVAQGRDDETEQVESPPEGV